MTIIASTLLLIVISLCLYSERLMLNSGYKLLLLFLFFTLFRFIIPLELPFSINRYWSRALSRITSFIMHEYIYLYNISLSVWDIFVIAWFAGFIVQLTRLINEYIRCRRYLTLKGTDITAAEPYKSILDMICRERRKNNSFRIYMLEDISTPMVYGIIRPYILMPTDMHLSQEDLYYTLSHEAAHHFHHDLLTKLGINLLGALYWWNPPIYILKRRANLLLEMRIDDKLTNNDRETTTSYLKCLINILELASERPPISPSLSLAFAKKDKSDLEKRFFMLCNRSKPKIYGLNLLLTVLIIGIYILSYVFILEAFYYPDEILEDEDGVEYFLTLDTTYLIENEDGTYEVYFDNPEMPDFHLETIDSSEYHEYYNIFTVYYLEKGNFK
ncbi:MAG: M56 family metallopeptidase [Lachnospiraceae bacterium]|nr:M56 family metallopeptidase [Lachnospiraceae bacterium]